MSEVPVRVQAPPPPSVERFVNQTIPTQLSREGIAPIAEVARMFAERPAPTNPQEIADRANEYMHQAGTVLGINTEKLPQANPDAIAEVAQGVPNGEALLLRHHTQLIDVPTRVTVDHIWNTYLTLVYAGIVNAKAMANFVTPRLIPELGLSGEEVLDTVRAISMLKDEGKDPTKLRDMIQKIATMKAGTVGSNRLNPIVDADKIAAASYGVMFAGIEQMVTEQTGQTPTIRFLASPNIRAGMSAMAMSETYNAVTGSATTVEFDPFLACPNVVLPYDDALRMMVKYNGDFPWANGDWTPGVHADVNKLFGTGTVERIHGSSPDANQSNTRAYVEGLIRPFTLAVPTGHTQTTNELMNSFGIPPTRLANGGGVRVIQEAAGQVTPLVQAKGLLK